jgi:hypothetical protein
LFGKFAAQNDGGVELRHLERFALAPSFRNQEQGAGKGGKDNRAENKKRALQPNHKQIIVSNFNFFRLRI